MDSTKFTEPSSDFMTRLDEVHMSARDREHAKAMMCQAEAFAEAAAHMHERLRETAAAVTRAFTSFHLRLRAALSHSAHR